MKYIFKAALGLLFLSGCCRSNGSCSHQNLDPAFIGWQTTDVDTLVFRRYTTGTTQLLDSSLISIKSFIGHGDTLSPGNVTSTGNSYLSGGYDWSVTLPKSGRVYSITYVTEAGSDAGKDCSIIPYKKQNMCITTVNGYQVDGSLVENSSGLIAVYMHK